MKDQHFKELFRKAVASGGNGDYKKAIRFFSSIVSQTDTYPQALLYLGRSYHALGEYERAVTILKHFINRRPELSAGYFFLGRSYCALEQYDRAVFYLKRARLRDNNNPHIESFLGLSYLKMRKPEKALVFLEQAVHLDPDNTSIYTGYLNALAVQGVRLFHLSDMDMAGQIFRFLEKADKDSLLTHIYLGIIERELGNIDKAIEHTDLSIALSDDPLLKLRKSSLLYQSGRRKEAADSLETLKQHYPEFQNITPKQEDLNRFLAVSLFQENKYVKAIHSSTIKSQSQRPKLAWRYHKARPKINLIKSPFSRNWTICPEHSHKYKASKINKRTNKRITHATYCFHNRKL